jgi:undecaprenyl-diphosphatase
MHDHLIVWTAQYLIYGMCGLFAVAWLAGENARGRIEVAIQAIVGVALCVLFIYLAGVLHTDPRPFVQDPSLHPLFAHGRDNGFPSDHAVAAGLIATLVVLRHRVTGIVLWLCAAAIAWARVAAHVHHVQDVVAGVLLGALGGALAVLADRLVLYRIRWTSIDVGRHHR